MDQVADPAAWGAKPDDTPLRIDIRGGAQLAKKTTAAAANDPATWGATPADEETGNGATAKEASGRAAPVGAAAQAATPPPTANGLQAADTEDQVSRGVANQRVPFSDPAAKPFAADIDRLNQQIADPWQGFTLGTVWRENMLANLGRYASRSADIQPALEREYDAGKQDGSIKEPFAPWMERRLSEEYRKAYGVNAPDDLPPPSEWGKIAFDAVIHTPGKLWDAISQHPAQTLSEMAKTMVIDPQQAILPGLGVASKAAKLGKVAEAVTRAGEVGVEGAAHSAAISTARQLSQTGDVSGGQVAEEAASGGMSFATLAVAHSALGIAVKTVAERAGGANVSPALRARVLQQMDDAIAAGATPAEAFLKTVRDLGLDHDDAAAMADVINKAGGGPPEPPPPGGGTGEPGAVQEPGAAEVLQRQPAQAAGAGGQRGGVEPGEQGQAPAQAGEKAQAVTPDPAAELQRLKDRERFLLYGEDAPTGDAKYAELKDIDAKIKALEQQGVKQAEPPVAEAPTGESPELTTARRRFGDAHDELTRNLRAAGIDDGSKINDITAAVLKDLPGHLDTPELLHAAADKLTEAAKRWEDQAQAGRAKQSEQVLAKAEAQEAISEAARPDYTLPAEHARDILEQAGMTSEEAAAAVGKRTTVTGKTLEAKLAKFMEGADAKTVQGFVDGQRAAIDAAAKAAGDVLGRVGKSPKAEAPAKSELIDTRGKGEQYHGTSSGDLQPHEGYYNDANIMGQGLYTSDAVDITHGYAQKGKGGKPSLFHVKEKTPVKLYDMEGPLTPELRDHLKQYIGDYLEHGFIDKAKNLREVINEFRDESANEQLSRDTVQEHLDAVREHLQNEGYRGYQHVGGARTKNAPHTVKIYWEPHQDLTITRREFSDFRKPDVGKGPGGRQSGAADIEYLARLGVVGLAGAAIYGLTGDKDKAIKAAIAAGLLPFAGKVLGRLRQGVEKLVPALHNQARVDSNQIYRDHYRNKLVPLLAKDALIRALNAAAKTNTRLGLTGRTGEVWDEASQTRVRDYMQGHAVQLSPKEQLLADQMRQVFDWAGKQAQDGNVIRTLIQDYLPGLYKIPFGKTVFDVIDRLVAAKALPSNTNTGMSPFTRHAQQKIFPDYRAAEAAHAAGQFDLVPLTRDPIVMLDHYLTSVINTLANKRLLDQLKTTTWDKNGTPTPLMLPVTGGSGTVNAHIARSNAISAAQMYPGDMAAAANWARIKNRYDMMSAPLDYELVRHPLLSDVRVHRDVVGPLKLLFDTADPRGVVTKTTNALYGISMARKAALFSLSLFHAGSLSLAAAPVLAGRLAGQAINLMRPDVWKHIPEAYRQVTGRILGPEYADAASHGMGVTTNNIDVDPKGLHKLLDLTDKLAAGLPRYTAGPLLALAPRGLKWMSDLLHDVTFKQIQPTLKLATYMMETKRWAEKNATATPAELSAAKRQIAAGVDNLYGGQNYFELANNVPSRFARAIATALFSPQGKKWQQVIALSPDWNISALRSWTEGAKAVMPGLDAKASDSLYRTYLLGSALMYMGVAQMAVKHYTGKDLWDLPDWSRIDMGDGRWMQFNKHFMEGAHLIGEPQRFIATKLSYLPAEILSQAFGKEYVTGFGLTRQQHVDVKGPEMRDKSFTGRLAHAAKAFSPITVDNLIKDPEQGVSNFFGIGTIYGRTYEDQVKDAQARAKAGHTDAEKELEKIYANKQRNVEAFRKRAAELRNR